MGTNNVMTMPSSSQRRTTLDIPGVWMAARLLTKLMAALKRVAGPIINRVSTLAIKLNFVQDRNCQTTSQASTQRVQKIIRNSSYRNPKSTFTSPNATKAFAEENRSSNGGTNTNGHSPPSCVPLAVPSTRSNKLSIGRPPIRRPSKSSRLPSHTISAASTETPADILFLSGSNHSMESRKTVHRKSTEVARNLSNAITSESSMGVSVQNQRGGAAVFHRRCQSTRALTTSEYFAKLLRTAICRKEANTVRDLLNGSVNDTLHDIGAIISNTINEEGYTLVHSAVLSQSQVILDCLLAALPSDLVRRRAVENTGGLGNKYSPLHLAALKENVMAASVLLDHGANANCTSKLGTTPLHLATSTCNGQMVDLLLRHGADPNAVSLVGNTPLISAVRKKSDELVRSLLAAGANPRASVEGGISAKALALEMNALDILEMLDGSVKLRGHTRAASLSQGPKN